MSIFWHLNHHKLCHSLVLASGFVFFMYAENLAKMSFPAVFDSLFFVASFGYLERKEAIRHSTCTRKKNTQKNNNPALTTYFGGASISSRYSSILFTSVRTSPLKVRKGGCVPGARLCRSGGFLRSNPKQQQIRHEHSEVISPKLYPFL